MAHIWIKELTISLCVITDKACNPSLSQIVKPNTNGTSSDPSKGDFVTVWAGVDWQSVLALALWFFAVLYSRYVQC